MTAPHPDTSNESRRALANAFQDVMVADKARREAERRAGARGSAS